MIPQQQSAAVTLGLNQTFGVSEFDDIRDLTERPVRTAPFASSCGDLHTCCDQPRAGDMLIALHLHAGGGRCGLGAACQVLPTPRSHLHHRFCGGCTFISADASVRFPPRSGPCTRWRRFPIPLQYHMHVPANRRTCPGRIPPDVPGVEHCLQTRPGSFSLVTSSGCGLLASRYGSAPAHNDLFSRDICSSIGKHLWLVDWGLHSPTIDMPRPGGGCQHDVTNELEERIYLQAYFGQPPDEYQRVPILFSKTARTHVLRP